MAEARDFIGRGWSFPFGFSARTGGVLRDEGRGVQQQLERIRDSLQQILGVRRGEMFMVRRFGSNMRDLIFQGIDGPLVEAAEFVATRAIEDEEFGDKRIFINRLSVDRDTVTVSAIIVRVNYTIRSSNVEGNLVFPLYLESTERLAAESNLQST